VACDTFEKRPGSQEAQLLLLVAFDAVEYVPAEHCLHVLERSELENLPISQGRQVVDPLFDV
jgi:hypothetical protein